MTRSNFQIFLTWPTCVSYMPFSCFFISGTLLAMIQIKTMQHQLRTISKTFNGNNEIDKELHRLIEFHKRLIEFIEELNSLVSFLCLVEFLSFGLMLIALLALLNVVSGQKFLKNKILCQVFSDSLRNCPVLHGIQLHLHDSLANLHLVLAFK